VWSHFGQSCWQSLAEPGGSSSHARTSHGEGPSQKPRPQGAECFVAPAAPGFLSGIVYLLPHRALAASLACRWPGVSVDGNSRPTRIASSFR
jgi:hypothetical protein